MFKKIISIITAAAMLFGAAAVLGSCGEQAEFPVKIGNITIEKEPENIVILDKNLADIISAIGYDVKMVGRSDEVNQKGLEVVPSMGAANDPSVTNIIKAKTEIVFAGSALNDADISKLKKANIIVAQFEAANTMKQLKSLYVKIGKMLGGNNEGRVAAVKAFKEIRDTLTAVKSAAKRDKTISTLAYLYAENGVLKTINNGCWANTLLGYTGSVNVFENAETDVVDIDNLMLANPNHIFVADKTVLKYLTTSDVLGDLDALGENTFVIPLDELRLQGYTSLDVVEKMLSDITKTTDDSSENDNAEESAE